MDSSWKDLIPGDILEDYELYNVNHAVEIMTVAYPNEFNELLSALSNFEITTNDILVGGGNESLIPKKISNILKPLGWNEVSISGDLLVCVQERNRSLGPINFKIENYIAGHNIDYVKNMVAFDLEWNSKDQTFDRDLYAFRTFYECGVIKCAAILTRSASLNRVFSDLGVKHKYGASTTWMGKLMPRINSNRHGGCPIFVIGITPNKIVDWNE